MNPSFNIAGRAIGEGMPLYIVAEISANHRSDFDRTQELVLAAKKAGADAVKVQTYTPDTITLPSKEAPFRISGGTAWDGRTLYELYAEASMPWAWQPKLKALADSLGMHFFSSAFDVTSVEFLETMNVPAYKVASFELVDLPLIQAVARTGKPIILSTGMATLDEIDEAVRTAQNAGASNVALLHCNSGYPAEPSEMNLRAITVLRERFACPIGLSDHTVDSTAALAAVALGACVIEKHLTLGHDDGGPDAGFSISADDFAALVHTARAAQAALGEPRFGPTPGEIPNLRFRRSLFVVQDVKKGELFTARNVRSIRPADGLHPRHLSEVLGRKAARDIPSGTPLKLSDVSPESPGGRQSFP